MIFQEWEILQNSLPKDIQIDVEISVNETISHADDVPPRDFGMLILRFIGNSDSSLTNYTQRINICIYDYLN